MLLIGASAAIASCDGSDATPVVVCGDGVWEPSTEECDDGNVIPGDGCTQTCEREHGWSCSLDGGCRPTCGDGETVSFERCDDGNVIAGDGCSPGCEIETGWYCTPDADGGSACGRQREAGEPCGSHVECLVGTCSYRDESSETESICIAGQGAACTGDTCPFHTWVDENGALHEGGCFPRRFGRGICLTGCSSSLDCPDGWFCGWLREESRGSRCTQPCTEDTDCLGENDWCAAGGWCFGTEPSGAPE